MSGQFEALNVCVCFYCLLVEYLIVNYLLSWQINFTKIYGIGIFRRTGFLRFGQKIHVKTLKHMFLQVFNFVI